MKTTDTTSEGAYYILTSESISLEWVGHCNYGDASTCKTQFSLDYAKNAPGIWRFRYYSVFDSGRSATVGVQGPGYVRSTQFSLDQPKVAAGTQVTCDTSGQGICVSSSFTL